MLAGSIRFTRPTKLSLPFIQANPIAFRSATISEDERFPYGSENDRSKRNQMLNFIRLCDLFFDDSIRVDRCIPWLIWSALFRLKARRLNSGWLAQGMRLHNMVPMNLTPKFISVSLAVLGLACTSLGAAPLRVLYFTKSAGYEHSVIKHVDGAPSFSENLLTKWAPKHDFEFTFSKDGSKFSPEYLAQFDVIMFYTSGHLLSVGTDGHPAITPEGKQALLHPGIDAARLDARFHLSAIEIVRIELHVAVEALELAADVADHHVADRKAHLAVRTVDIPGHRSLLGARLHCRRVLEIT